MSKREYDDDDGRVIVPMDVDGMPGFFKRPRQEKEADVPRVPKVELSKQESRAVIGGVLKAAFTVLLIYAVVFALFILFCQFVWFR